MSEVYLEMAKLAKRIEFLEAVDTLSGSKSWLELEKRVKELERKHEDKDVLKKE